MAARKPKSRKKKGLGVAGLFIAALLAALAGAAGAAWLILMPFGPAKATLVNIAPGSSAERIGRELEEAEVVRSRFAFDAVRLWKRGTLKAGFYRFEGPATPPEVYGKIERGEVYTIAVTIPEGANVFGIATRLAQAGLGSRQQFLETAVEQVGLVANLDPEAKSLEGYLFPDTYRFSPDATDEQMAAAMVHRFREVAGELGLNGNVHRVVTIASLVERETAVNAERPLVASVFENRLAKKMPLMSDPSVIYGLELAGRWTGAIHESDLSFDTAYNTYLHAGLPPGPVANPGIPSLKAAMDPAETKYLYFVAAGMDPQGKSLFAATLREQNKNVAGYRKAEKRAVKR
ncbi:MAG: endolytic transglycosylase MltG [Terracidiphilus sp.]